MEVWKLRNHSANTHLVLGAAVGEFLLLCVVTFMAGRKVPMERKRWKETRATFLRALEYLEFGKKKKIISLFSHFFQPLRRCAQNNLKMLLTFAGY